MEKTRKFLIVYAFFMGALQTFVNIPRVTSQEAFNDIVERT